MFKLILFAIVAVLVLGVVGTLYVKTLMSHMTTASVAIGKPQLLDGLTGLTWFGTKLMGWKTIVLGWIAAATQATSFLLATDYSPFKDLPWEKLFSERIANYVTFAIALLMTVTHAQGYSKAAQTPPQD